MQPSGRKITQKAQRKEFLLRKITCPWKWPENKNPFLWVFSPKELYFFSKVLGCVSEFQKMKNLDIFIFFLSKGFMEKLGEQNIFSCSILNIVLLISEKNKNSTWTPHLKTLLRFLLPPFHNPLSPFSGCRGSPGDCDTPLETHPETAQHSCRASLSIKHCIKAHIKSHFFPLQLSLPLLCLQGPPNIAQP